MREKRIYLSAPNVGEPEKRTLIQAMEDGWVAPAGPQLAQFEKELEQIFEGRRVLGVNSGTSALHLSLIMAGVERGDEVLIGSFTFAACGAVVKYQRAIPVFLDSEEESWNLDPELLEEYLSHCKKKPKAIIVTHLYGVPARIDEIKRICLDHDLILIEDAAEALGSLYSGHPVGAFGNMGIVSFNGNKIITTSGGGVLITDQEGYERGRHLSTQANTERFGYNHKEVGYNYRLSNILASMGLGQITMLESFISRKREIFECYKTSLSSGVFEFPEEPANTFCNRWLTTPLINKEFEERVNPLELIRFLDEKNIECRQLWKPLHLHSLYSGCRFYGTGVAEEIYKRGLCLPSGTGLSDEELNYVISLIDEYINLA